MYKSLKHISIVLIMLVASFFLGSICNSISRSFNDSPSYNIENVVLVSRSPNWKYSLGFYVAVVLAEKSENGFNVRCKVHVGNNNYYESIPLGAVSTIEEAYAKWGTLTWSDNELIIGATGSAVSVKRSRIESHR